MGNCIILQEKPASVMKTDGKFIDYETPIKVDNVLSEFSHHGIPDELPAVKHLHPNTEMALQPTKKKKKTVRFSEDIIEKEEKRGSGVVRIKLVITKQKLQAMLGEEGVLVEDIISQVQKEPTKFPLESIPELS